MTLPLGVSLVLLRRPFGRRHPSGVSHAARRRIRARPLRQLVVGHSLVRLWSAQVASGSVVVSAHSSGTDSPACRLAAGAGVAAATGGPPLRASTCRAASRQPWDSPLAGAVAARPSQSGSRRGRTPTSRLASPACGLSSRTLSASRRPATTSRPPRRARPATGDAAGPPSGSWRVRSIPASRLAPAPGSGSLRPGTRSAPACAAVRLGGPARRSVCTPWPPTPLPAPATEPACAPSQLLDVLSTCSGSS